MSIEATYDGQTTQTLFSHAGNLIGAAVGSTICFGSLCTLLNTRGDRDAHLENVVAVLSTAYITGKFAVDCLKELFSGPTSKKLPKNVENSLTVVVGTVVCVAASDYTLWVVAGAMSPSNCLKETIAVVLGCASIAYMAGRVVKDSISGLLRN